MTSAAGREGGEGKRHHKLIFTMPDGSCHEGTTPNIGGATIFVESREITRIGTEVSISLVPREEDTVGEQPVQGTVAWHCSVGDAFQNQAGFGVLLQQHVANRPTPDTANGPKGET